MEFKNECHGSSHPSCNGYSYGTYEARICEQEKTRAANEKFNACMAQPECKASFEHDQLIMKCFLGSGVIIIIIMFLALFYAIHKDL